MIIDSSKSPTDNVWTLINAANHTSFTSESGFLVGTPVAFNGPSNHNTKMTLTADQSGKYRGTQDVFYTRLSVLQNVTNPSTTLNVPSRSATKADILTLLVSTLNLVASEVSLVESVYPDIPSVTMVANPGSLLYVGSQVFSLTWPKPTFAEYLGTNRLMGFDPLS